MKYRKLRIAWSMAWGFAAVLLCVLWMRSCWWYDCARVRVSQAKLFEVTSMYGKLIISDGQMPPPTWLGYWGQTHRNPEKDPYNGFVFKRVVFKDGSGVIMPYWVFVVLAAMVGALSWLRWPQRFSLRTLLIATTLVAVVLGILVYVSG